MIGKRYTEHDDKFFRAMIFPEEERHRFTAKAWDGSFRWFRANNVICLEHYRRMPADQIESKPAA